jgi:hypothetical protein
MTVYNRASGMMGLLIPKKLRLMEDQRAARPTSPAGRPGQWALVIILAAVAGGLLSELVLSVGDARAQQHTAVAGETVFVAAGQISGETYGLYLVDYENKTICIYEYVPQDRRLRLRAARTYRFDAQLDEYNTDQPLPREVKDLVEQHGRLGTEQ